MPGDAPDDVVRSAFLASNRGDVEAFLRCLHPDIRWESAGLFLYPARLWSGHADLREGLRDRVRRFGSHPRVTLTEVRRHDPWVLVTGTLEVPGSRLPETWIVTMRDGLMVGVDAFTSATRADAEWRRRTGQPA